MQSSSAPRSSTERNKQTFVSPKSQVPRLLILGYGLAGVAAGIAALYAVWPHEVVESISHVGAASGLWLLLGWIYERSAKNPTRALDVIDSENVLTYSRLTYLRLLPSQKR